MAYYDIALLAEDGDFLKRVAACYAHEVPGADPWPWVNANAWRVAAQPGFGDAYGYAMANTNEVPGRDAVVITDGMILAAVGALIQNPISGT